MKSLKQFVLEQLHYKFDLQFPDILEMAQVNTYDNDGVFNKNKMKIQVYGGSSEHNPPHVHIMDKSRTFDIRVSIEDEELISVKKENRRVNYNEIVGDFRMWSKKYTNNPAFKGKTNKYMCINAWNVNNPDKLIYFEEENEDKN